MTFGAVIATRNRARLLRRAIESVLASGEEQVEIVVVDDCSSDDTCLTASAYPSIRYLRQPENLGPGRARNRGLGASTADWVLVLDDDDVMVSGGFGLVRSALQQLVRMQAWPVVQFRTDNGTPGDEFHVTRIEDYLSGYIRGDYTAVINRPTFLERGLAYPDLLIGGEHLLWMRIAESTGIPTWSHSIVQTGSDAPTRICSSAWQLAHARHYAELQDETIRRFRAWMKGPYARQHRTRLLGAATYWLVAGERRVSRARSREAVARFGSLTAAGLFGLSYLPSGVARRALLAWRRWQGL